MAGDAGERERLAAALKRAVDLRFASVGRAASQPGAIAGGISFNAELLHAVLAGRKTQTRRPIRPVPATVRNGVPINVDEQAIAPPVRAGERLWVREKWGRAGARYVYAVDEPHAHGVRWQASRFMPRDAARTFLDVRSVAVQRLSEISQTDALCEGADGAALFDARTWFLAVWDAIYGTTEHASRNDPWVWSIAFQCARAAASDGSPRSK